MATEAGGELLAHLNRTVDLVQKALAELDDWQETVDRPKQYRCDVAADEVAVAYLLQAGFAVLSEETGKQGSGPMLAVLDPVDGSTNAAAGIPFYATSIAVLDGSTLVAGLVANLVTGVRYEAIKGEGAWKSGERLSPRESPLLSRALVAVNGWPVRHLGWRQYRVLGAASLELCLVADGALDGFVDFSGSGLAPWDYLGGLLVCTETGALVEDADGRDLLCTDDGSRRALVAAAGGGLLSELSEKRRSLGPTIRQR